MNRTKIKNYAPQARRDFIQAVSDRAAFYGLTADRTEPVTVKGDVALIAGRAFPREVADKRKALQERVERDGYEPTMEALAYTWFNRLVAIRYMELHGYLEHGYRVLSHPDPARAMPEILEHAEHVELPGLNRDRVIELKLDGTREAELYRMLLVAQCNALHSAMPFLFERIGDETELVLPESLLHCDSIVRKLVSGIDEEDWQEVEIIGWLYEAYISERYEQVIGKVVASPDIPAATQRFTPKWIVRYLVQNTLGRLWLATYPKSPLKAQMKYYIEPAEQTPEVQEQLRAITPTSLNPEEITFLDPACGSAHILVEAYDLFKAIYQERGYRARDIPRLILGKNLFGLEIDDRAAQLAAFALMMKSRADDRRIFDQGIQPHVRTLVQTDGMDAEDVAAALNASGSTETPPPGLLFETDDNLFTRAASTAIASTKVSLSDVKVLIGIFEHAKTFGSLIQVAPALADRLPQIEQRCRDVAGLTGEIASRTAARFLPVIEQARMMGSQFDCVVTNPPYIGMRAMNGDIRDYLQENYPLYKLDTYAAFIARSRALTKRSGICSLISMHSWMFLHRFESTRRELLESNAILSLVHLGARAFSSLSGEVVQTCAFALRPVAIPSNIPAFLKCVDGQESEKDIALREKRHPFHRFSQRSFLAIEGGILAYWVSEAVMELFHHLPRAELLASPRHGMVTSDNARFLRNWWEVGVERIGLGFDSRRDAATSGKKWFPYNKGGPYRKWYGNIGLVINWENDGEEVVAFAKQLYGSPSRKIQAQEFYFCSGVTWSALSSADVSMRANGPGFLFDSKGSSMFFRDDETMYSMLAVFNSKPANYLLEVMAPTLDFSAGAMANLPVPLDRINEHRNQLATLAKRCVSIAKTDWDSSETSWEFVASPLSLAGQQTAADSLRQCAAAREERAGDLAATEETINSRLIADYGLVEELTPHVPTSKMALDRPAPDEDIKRLISYSVGCMMGRYSLDKPGMNYAHGGNVGFDPGQYRTFPADPDGIVPVMEADWFADDATHRFIEFLGVVWPGETLATDEHGLNTDQKDFRNDSDPCSIRVSSVARSSLLEENLKFVADSLNPSRGEQPRDTIRRYLVTGFYKHHLQTYKRRPIYWMFSSGKQRAFQCLVYLHRYHEGTLSRLRTEYIIPLQGKIAQRIDQLAGDIPRATSTSHRTTLTRERDKLLKQQAELQAYDEKLRHHADMRIALDLDDGVKVNYSKFGDLLAEVKAVTGERYED